MLQMWPASQAAVAVVWGSWKQFGIREEDRNKRESEKSPQITTDLPEGH